MITIKKLYKIFIIIFIIVIYYLSYSFNIDNLPKKILSLLEYRYNDKKINYKIDFISLVINNYKYNNHFIDNEVIETTNEIVFNDNNPIIYIYNTHTNEEYKYNKNDLYNITPTVKTASYILQSELNKYGINSIVEESNVIDILNNRNLNYSSSYKISRELLENKKINNPSLIYFIDIHRDSVKREITTVNINNETYARVMFLLGLENSNYLENKKVMEELDNYLNDNYKGLSRGIYEKSGPNVNGIYNQDFNLNTILIEVGGVDNTITEVSNSIKVIASMLYNYIEKEKTTNIE